VHELELRDRLGIVLAKDPAVLAHRKRRVHHFGMNPGSRLRKQPESWVLVRH
jgi:hypothetical protein